MTTTAVTEPRYFFIIGAMKAGTTSLYKYLAAHPELCASARKEPRIFRDPADPETLRGELQRLFERQGHERWCFEGSTAYTKYPGFPGVPQRVAAVVPDARFVYLVRNPVERTWSQYVHNLAHGRESLPFERAVTERPEYLDVSRYHLQLTQYHNVFPPDRVLVQVFEEMVKDPGATVRNVCAFLGVDTSYAPPSTDVAFNASSTKRTAPLPLQLMAKLGVDELVPWRMRHWLRAQGAPLPRKERGMTSEIRAQLVELLRPDAEAFFGVLGRRIPSWKDFA